LATRLSTRRGEEPESWW